MGQVGPCGSHGTCGDRGANKYACKCETGFQAVGGNRPLKSFGWSGHAKGKLQACQGDCDKDAHCAAGLICKQRNGYTAVPGCKPGGAGDVSGKDYCYDPSPGETCVVKDPCAADVDDCPSLG